VTGTPARPLLEAARLAPPTWGPLLLALAAGIGAAASAVGLAAASAWLIARAAEQPPVLFLIVAIVSVRTFGIARGVLRYAERVLAHETALRWLTDLRVQVVTRLEALAPAGLPAFRNADLLSRIVSDVDTLADLWLRIVLPAAVAMLVGAATVGLLAWLLPAVGLLVAALALLAAMGAPWLGSLVARRADRGLSPARAVLAAEVLELVDGLPEVVVLGREDDALAAVQAADARLADAERRSAVAAGAAAGVATLAGGLAVWGSVLLGVPAVRDGRLAGVALAVVVLTPIALFELVAGLAPLAQLVPRVRAAAERVLAVVAAPVPVAEPCSPASLPPGRELEAVGVRARWLPEGPEVLRGVDLLLRSSATVAVVGPSGSGKSTLAAVLLRFLDPIDGEVRLGGVDTATLAGDEVRRVVGLLTQDAHVFDTTLRENLLLARRAATDAELLAALDRARLGPTVARWPDGLDTFVGERGGLLSGGERQRLGLARILLADFPVVVLDEPTEHLDEATADEVLHDVLAVADGRSVLLITHRPVDRLRVERMLAVRDGRLVEA
jgi:thiol reductant ABC exporter CydC subunit